MVNNDYDGKVFERLFENLAMGDPGAEESGME